MARGKISLIVSTSSHPTTWPAPRPVQLSATSASAATAGGSGALNAATGATCSWTAKRNTAWVTLAAGDESP